EDFETGQNRDESACTCVQFEARNEDIGRRPINARDAGLKGSFCCENEYDLERIAATFRPPFKKYFVPQPEKLVRIKRSGDFDGGR
ncbi:hypothetical protein, partial [Collimonas sp. OK607]|uniref:hypothetical protein n=1 Tax=Collimonas sp. OK607 TaxID=1798194 RepID=UPI00147F8348